MTTVLPEYTDEHLRQNLQHHDPGVRQRATELLRLPANLRQAAEVKVNQRCTRHRRTDGGLIQVELVGSPDGARAAVVDEMLRRGKA